MSLQNSPASLSSVGSCRPRGVTVTHGALRLRRFYSWHSSVRESARHRSVFQLWWTFHFAVYRYLREGLTLVKQCVHFITSQGGGRRALVNLGLVLAGRHYWFQARRGGRTVVEPGEEVRGGGRWRAGLVMTRALGFTSRDQILSAHALNVRGTCLTFFFFVYN